MKTILKQLKNYIKETILGPLFKLFEAILELLVPLIVSLIIDKGINDGINTDKKLIIISFVGLLLIALVGFIFAIIAQYFSAKAAVGVSSGMRRELYSKIHSLSFKDLDESGTSSLITRMTSDINQVQTGVNLTLRLFLRSPIIVFGAMIMSFTISLKFAFIFISVIIALLVVVLGIMFICIPLYEKAQEKLDKVTLSTRENLVGARVIRAFTKEDEEIELFKERNRDLTKLQKVIGTISGLMNPLTFVIVNVAIIILLNKGAISIEMGDLTQGQVLALYNYLSIILTELVKLANLIITINKALACSNRIEKVLSKDISLKFDNSSKENVPYISFENVSMKYHEKSNVALKNINFSINKGETVGIIGGTGSGKSSLINLLPHLYDYSEGDIYLEGKSIRSYQLTTLRDKFGVVPQKSVLFKGTIKENLTWRKKDASEEEILEAVKIAQAEDVILSKDRGLNSLVEQGGSNFSGGQKQRLCIARALVGNPEILILDDSSSALDYATDKKLRMSLKQLDYKPTTIIVSQRTSAISHADKIVVLDKGEIVGIGTHDDLLKTCRVYQEIHFSQTKKEVY